MRRCIYPSMIILYASQKGDEIGRTGLPPICLIRVGAAKDLRTRTSQRQGKNALVRTSSLLVWSSWQQTALFISGAVQRGGT
jgi:hypothetical protein